MAIAFDAATFGHDNGGTGVLAFNHTVGASATLLLLFTQGSQTSDSIVSPTYNSVALTKLASTQGTASTRWIQAWGLLSPSTGTHSLSIPSTSDYIQGFTVSYSGTSTAALPSLTHTNFSNSATTLADSVTTTVDLSWVVMFTRLDSNGGPGNAGTGTTRRAADTDFDSASLFDSNAAVTPAGSKTLTCNAAGVADPMADIILAVAPPSAGGTRGLFRTPSGTGIGVGGSFFRDPLQGRAQVGV